MFAVFPHKIRGLVIDKNLLFEEELKRENWFYVISIDTVYSLEVSCQGQFWLGFFVALGSIRNATA